MVGAIFRGTDAEHAARGAGVVGGLSPLGRSLLTATWFLCLGPASARAQLVVQEPGFTVTTIAQGVVEPRGLECSPGGIWGDYVNPVTNGEINRIKPSGSKSVFASILGAMP